MPPKSKSFLPLLVIFGIEHTLWPFYIYTVYKEFTPPFVKNSFDEIVDSKDKVIPCNYDVQAIFEKLQEDGIQIGVATIRGDFAAFEELLELFEWNQFIKYKEMSSEDFKTVFETIHNKSGIAYSDMMFFDDKDRNIQEVSGEFDDLYCKRLQDGITYKLFEEGINDYKQWKQGWLKTQKAKEKIKLYAANLQAAAGNVTKKSTRRSTKSTETVNNVTKKTITRRVRYAKVSNKTRTRKTTPS